MIDTTILRELLEDHERFSEIAVSLPWAETTVTYIQETKAHPHQWAFITVVRFPQGYVNAHFAEAYVQTRITHLSCTEEWGADSYKDWTPEEKRLHLQSFQSEYTGFKLDLSTMQAEDVAKEITDHCKAPFPAERILPLLTAGASVYIGWYADDISWDYLTVSGDTVMLITLSVAA